MLALLATLSLATPPPPEPPPPEPILVLVAADRLPRGHVVTRDDLVLVEVPVRPAFDAFSDPDALVGAEIKEDVLADEVLRRERLVIDNDPRAGLEGRVTPGNRAIALRPRLASDPVSAGSRADLRWGPANEEPTCWVAQDVPVLATVNPEGGVSTADRHPSTLWIVVDVDLSTALQLQHGVAIGDLTTTARTDGATPLPEDTRCREPMSVYLR